MDELLYWIGLNSISGVGPKKIQLLLKKFGSPREILRASVDSLSSINGIDKGAANAITQGFDKHSAEEQIELAEKMGIKIIALDMPDYPKMLSEIFDPPPVLYVKGEIREQGAANIAIVGTRKVTTYGKFVTRAITRELASAGITIVSGMARGVDSIAHHHAIACKAKTIAVLGCGIDICYPPENKDLMEQIALNGAVVSEFPIGTFPDAFHFPRRNRIISGLSHGILVTEAGEKSGALITTDFALEQGRDVFAIPGPVNMSTFTGCHHLIKQGAALVTSAQDILYIFKKPLMAFPAAEKKEISPVNLNEEEKMLYAHLAHDPVHIDILSQKCGHPSAKVLGILLGMELRGIIQQLAGKNFVKV